MTGDLENCRNNRCAQFPNDCHGQLKYLDLTHDWQRKIVKRKLPDAGPLINLLDPTHTKDKWSLRKKKKTKRETIIKDTSRLKSG